MNYTIENLKAPITKRVRTDDGFGHKGVPDGFVRGYAVVVIDELAIERMAIRAMKSKSGRCVSGSVVVKARDRRREPA